MVYGYSSFMVKTNSKRLSREDWLLAALELLSESGVEAVRIVPLAKKLGVTSGSFYWHFKNRPELYRDVLDYWEREMTDKAIERANGFKGSPRERIWLLMEQVMLTGMARYDLAVWHWAQADATAKEVFTRTMEKRFSYASWMFEQIGFDKTQAEVRSRMMVVYMMGESTLLPEGSGKRQDLLKLKYKLLTEL